MTLATSELQVYSAEDDSATSPRRAPVTTIVMALLCAVALSISGYLAWTALQAGEVFGCGGGQVFDCSHILTSHWSKVFSIPVSVPAFGLYASLLAVLAFMRPSAPEPIIRMGWTVLVPGAVAAGLAALWFVGLQIFAIGHYCPYCLVAHTCGLALAAIVLFSNPLQKLTVAKLSTLGLLATGGLVAAQLLTPEQDAFKIERYTSQPSADGSMAAESTAESSNADVSAPPVIGDSAGQEGEIFAPPGELFQPPIATQSPNPSQPSDTEVDEASAGPDSQSNDNDPSVVSTLMLLLPARTATLNLLPVVVQQQSDSSSEVSDSSATQDKAATEAEAKPEISERIVGVAGNKFRLNTRQWPLIGDPDAKYIFVEMFDYTCPHCRRTHGAISGACKRYGDDLAIIALPVPLERKCNSTVSSGGSQHAGACDVACLAVAVWRVKPSVFSEYHDWLFESASNCRVSVARKKAESLVGKDALKEEMDKPYSSQYVARHVELYKRMGAGSVPKLLFPDATLTGSVNSTTTLCNTIERELASK